jgi:serine/threonine protein kinase/tetratricopeptide (TPR) repeat protein
VSTEPVPSPPARTPPEIPEDPTLSIHTSEATLGTFIDAYKLIRQRGEGGMGIVYQAQQREPIRRDVALKVIKPGMDSKQVIARFEGERQALAMMDHGNIARVFDAGTTATGLPYFVMELVDGIPITRYCDSHRLTVKERIELFIPVCQAIQHAHQKGIIHRDIKPSNILVKQQENQAVPKVIDFGLAKALGGQLTDATMMTNLGTVVGTLQYMSPEQAEVGRHDIDTRSDVYSLGAVFYELLTGSTPMDSGHLTKATYVEFLEHIRNEEAKPPSVRLRRSGDLKSTAALRQCDAAQLLKLLDHELDWIVMKALDKDRERRYETVNGLVRDLQRYLEGVPVEAAPPSKAYRARKFVRRHRLGFATALAFMAVLVAGVLVSTLLAVRASRAEQEARAVNAFLQDDLLAQASASRQARPDTKPNPHLEVRTALDRAAANIGGKFEKQPLVEASIRQTIGNTYTDLGLYANAQGQLERALELRNRLLGGKHPDTLVSMNRLARVYERQARYAQAEPLYETVLAAQRRVLGQDHPDTLLSINGLAAVYYGQGKLPQAEALFATLLDSRSRILGSENPETVLTMGNLAAVYHAQGKFAQAEPLYGKTLEIRRRISGEEHPETLKVMVNLAELFRDQRRYEPAEPLFTQALSIQSKVLGENHRDTIYTINSLAGLYGKLGKYPQSEVLYVRAQAAERDGIGESHPFALETMNGLADTYQIQGKYAQAGILYGRLLENYRKTTSDVWERYQCQSMMGASRSGQKKYAEAEPLLVSGYEGMLQRRAAIPQDRPALQEAGDRIVRLYADWGKPEKTAEWRKKLQEVGLSVPPKIP